MKDFDDIMRRTYFTAIEAQSLCRSVQIHVGQEVWDALRARAAKLCDKITESPNPTMWGFPILLEETRAPGHVSIHTVEVIA